MTTAEPGPSAEAAARHFDARDREEIVEDWMAIQLLTERQMYQLLRGPLAQKVRRLSLLELDVITQLDPQGERASDLAKTLRVDGSSLRPVVDRLVRRGLLLRQGRGQAGRIQRTEQAEQLISLLRQAQADLLVGIFAKMPAELQGRTIDLMQALTPAPAPSA